MTDLDFDELDKAVTSIINKKGRKSRESSIAPDTVSQSAVPLTSSSPSASANVITSAPSNDISSATPSAPSMGASIAPRRGRFMDMVHPSADMHKPATPAASVTRISRQGVQLAPITAPTEANEAEKPTQESPTAASASFEQSTNPQPETSISSTDEALEEPSKLPKDESWQADDSYTYHEDTAPLHTGEEKEPLISSRDVIELETKTADLTQSSTSAIEPQAPSFVSSTPEIAVPEEDTDAAFATLTSTPETQEKILDSIPNTDRKPTNDEPLANDEVSMPEAEPSQPMTSPFVPDVKVDKRPLGSTSASVAAEKPHEEVTQLPERKGGDDDPQTLAELDCEVGDTIGAVDMSLPPQAEIATATTAVSIAQQYKTVEKPTDETAGSIYDTSTYHKPVTEVPKKRRAFSVIIWVIMLLMLSIIAGAATYYFTLNK